MRTSGTPNWLRVLAGTLALWVFLVGMILLEVVPYTPRTPQGWALLLLAGPPAYLVLQWFGEEVVGKRVARIRAPRYSASWFAWMLGMIAFGCAVVALSVWWVFRFSR
jgi:hypothetical protein